MNDEYRRGIWSQTGSQREHTETKLTVGERLQQSKKTNDCPQTTGSWGGVTEQLLPSQLSEETEAVNTSILCSRLQTVAQYMSIV